MHNYYNNNVRILPINNFYSAAKTAR